MDYQKGCIRFCCATALVFLLELAYVVCFSDARGYAAEMFGSPPRSSFGQITTYRENYILPYSRLSKKLAPRPATVHRTGPVFNERLAKRFGKNPINSEGGQTNTRGHNRNKSSADWRKGRVFPENTARVIGAPLSPEDTRENSLKRTLTLTQQQKAKQQAEALVQLIGQGPSFYQSQEDDIQHTLQELVHELVPRPEHKLIENKEVIFQVSLKAPIFQLKKLGTRVYGAYTQQAWWQCFTGVSAFFREVNFMPEVFLEQHLRFKVGKYLELNQIKLSFIHQSNGTGIDWERSWNRMCLEISGRIGIITITMTPWWVLNTTDMRIYNPDIGSQLGWWQLKASVHTKQFGLSFEKRSNSYHVLGHVPLTKALNFIFYYFDGKGSTLGAHDRDNRIWGVGVGK